MKKLATLLTITSTALLTACGGTGSEGGSGSSVSSTTINSMAIEGSAAASDGVVPINSGINGGAFKVKWDVSSSNPYHVRLYVSKDAVLSTSTDQHFFSQNCGTPTSIYNCTRTANFNCSFNTENQIVCNETAYNRGKNLSSFLETLPEQAYLIMHACNGLFNSCKTEAMPIELQ